MDHVIERIVALDRAISRDGLTPEVAAVVKRHLVDAVGCALAGYHEDVAVIARAVADDCRSEKPATVLGAGRGAPAELAAFANGVMIRCLDLNDTYASAVGIGHPSDYIPAVLAAAEEAGASGRTAAEGLVAAYEVFGRLTDATAYGVTGWDHTSNGVIASAVGAGHAFGLTDEQLGNAIALAAVANFALHETRIGTVSMWKGCASANACRNGVFAARLAGLGVTGPPAVFEGRSGIIATAAPRFDITALETSPGNRVITACHLKRYPAGFFSQSAIDAARAVRQRSDGHGAISAVRLGTFPFGKAVMAGDDQKWAPRTRESADHSLPYLVAVALVRGDVGTGDFTPEALADPAVRAVLDVLTVAVDDECAAGWPAEARSAVAVTFEDGSTDEEIVRDYSGHSRNPMPDAAVNEKFLAGASQVLSAGDAAMLLKRLWNIDQLDDAAELLAVTIGAGA